MMTSSCSRSRGLHVLTACVALAWSSLAAASNPNNNKMNANGPPSTGQEWISLDQGMEFQPASSTNRHLNEQQQHTLKRAQERFLQQESGASNSRSVVDSQETYWDAYAQSWRYVGFYTDCNPTQDDRRRRRLNDDEETACVRYLLWAAYVDLEYDGNGLGGYQFYDTYANEWDTTACQQMGDLDHCRKMDCHLPDTQMQLLGYFKELEYTEWFEQLFKHEGYCVWQGNEYEFMYNNYGAWPEACSETEYYTSDGTLLYYDTKASANGTMGYGLYKDARCSEDYMGDDVTVEQVLGGDDGDGDLLSGDYLDYWNEAMEIYKVCQPCRSYALNSYGGNGNDRKLAASSSRKLDDNDANGGQFQCDDAAGYTNVNQCMKFSSKTDMLYANFEEVAQAAQQGGITSVTINGHTFGQYKAGYVEPASTIDYNLLWISCAVFGFGLICLLGVLFWMTNRCCGAGTTNKSLQEPLMDA